MTKVNKILPFVVKKDNKRYLTITIERQKKSTFRKQNANKR